MRLRDIEPDCWYRVQNRKVKVLRTRVPYLQGLRGAGRNPIGVEIEDEEGTVRILRPQDIDAPWVERPSLRPAARLSDADARRKVLAALQGAPVRGYDVSRASGVPHMQAVEILRDLVREGRVVVDNREPARKSFPGHTEQWYRLIDVDTA